MNKRREWKKAAKATLKKHYWMLMVMCLFASFLGIEYGKSFTIIHMQMPKSNTKEIVTDLLEEDKQAAEWEVEKKEEEIRQEDHNPYLGHSRGVFSSLLNSYSSGSYLVAGMDALENMIGSEKISIALLILAAFGIYTFFWLFIKETYLVVMRRIVLESRTYEKVPISRFFYPVQIRKWRKIAWGMLVKAFYLFWWSFTIIGGVIKSYSYSMVPYILAENPDVDAKTAITLSRKMMKGHKWEYFKADLSFFGWGMLDIVTLGLSGIFYSNPYKAAFLGEYYTYLRTLAIENQLEGVEVLKDAYLYEKPTEEEVEKSYPDLLKFMSEKAEKQRKIPGGVRGILSRFFGIVLLPSKEVQEYEQQKADSYKIEQGRMILARYTYPERMMPVPVAHKTGATSRFMPTKSYSVLHLIMMFFIISMIGWVWEVSLHLISDGVFVNRGVLHGPWLPIYGTGGILILILLKSLRENPMAEFIAATVLCGCVEYYTAWHLEQIHNGQKWWDYSGYFLNLHGRICGEGLLVFGLGGLAIVYLLAPFLDSMLDKMNKKLLVILAAVLLLLYVGDQSYSSKHPNTGEGITNVSEEKNFYESTENLNDYTIEYLNKVTYNNNDSIQMS